MDLGALVAVLEDVGRLQVAVCTSKPANPKLLAQRKLKSTESDAMRTVEGEGHPGLHSLVVEERLQVLAACRRIHLSCLHQPYGYRPLTRNQIESRKPIMNFSSDVEESGAVPHALAPAQPDPLPSPVAALIHRVAMPPPRARHLRRAD